MSIPYRSLTNRAGRLMAGARALWRANGMTDAQMTKPVIAIANSFTQFVPGHVHLHDIGQEIKALIEERGCFAAEFKLRTVIWEFGGDEIEPELLDDIGRVADEVPPAFTELLDDDEVDAFRQRCSMLITNRRYPIDRTGHRYPWPLV